MSRKIEKIERLLNVHDGDSENKPTEGNLIFQQRVEDWIDWSLCYSVGDHVSFHDAQTKGAQSSFSVGGRVQSVGEQWHFHSKGKKRKLKNITTWLVLTGITYGSPN